MTRRIAASEDPVLPAPQSVGEWTPDLRRATIKQVRTSGKDVPGLCEQFNGRLSGEVTQRPRDGRIICRLSANRALQGYSELDVTAADLGFTNPDPEAQIQYLNRLIERGTRLTGLLWFNERPTRNQPKVEVAAVRVLEHS